MTTSTVTWDELAALEPRLAELRADVESVKDDGESEYFCANHWWYRTFKPRLVSLVGFEAGNPTYVRPVSDGERKYELLSMADLIARSNEGRQQRQERHLKVPALLRTSDAYDCTYRTLYNLLPDCRDCGE